jgi:hypothetical protein
MTGDKLNCNLLLDFWKMPTGAITVNNDNGRKTGQVNIIMPDHPSVGEPRLYTWGQTKFYAPVHLAGIGQNADLACSTLAFSAPQDSTVTLPFNLNEAIHNLLYEKYMVEEAGQQFLTQLRRLYYWSKPLLPRFIQVALRRQSVHHQSRRTFPAWPVDHSVDLIRYQVLKHALMVGQGSSLPAISFWPDGADFCLVLSHDIEQQPGYENIQLMVDLEKKYGFRSSWNFVPKRYPVDITLVNQLKSDGYEVGVHGLHHDGRLFESLETFKARALEINRYLQLWECAGFRSPSNIRNFEWISQYICAEYDSSGLSAELYGIQPGGSCTVFPFLISPRMVELPITLQQDFTLLDVLKLTPEETLTNWITTVESIENVKGMVLINTHPDYMNTPERLEIYEQFLSAMCQKRNAWHALPRDVARWWLDRHNSELVSLLNSWCVQGPASGKAKVMQCACEQGELTIRPYQHEPLSRETSFKSL